MLAMIWCYDCMLWEVIASDFSKNLAQETLTEEEAQSEYEKMTQANKITKASAASSVVLGALAWAASAAHEDYYFPFSPASGPQGTYDLVLQGLN